MSNDRTISDRLADELATGEANLERAPTLVTVPEPIPDPTSMLRTVRALKTAVDTIQGASGSVLDRLLTLRDLLKIGAISYSPAYGLLGGNATININGGDGGGGTPVDLSELGDYYATPPTPTNLSATATLRSVILEWDLITYRNHAFVEVRRNTTNNVGSATLIGSIAGNVFLDGDVAYGTTYYYWVRAVNVQGVSGSYNAVGGVSAAPGRVGTSDLADDAVTAAKIANGEISASKLAVGAVELTKFAAGIEPVSIVTGALPGAKTTAFIWRTDDGKLYRWDGSAYTKAVPAVDVSGQLTDAQIAALAAAKLTGQITNTQISDNAISTPKIQAGAISTDQLAASAVVADKIAANTITGGKIAANTITGTNIQAGSISADRLVSNSITAAQIQAGAIGADQIAAGAIRTDKLLVTGRGSVLNDDPGCQDTSAWGYGGHGDTATQVTVTDGVYGNKAFRSNAAASSVDSRLVPVTSDKRYRVSVWVRRSASANGFFYLRLLDQDGNSLNNWVEGAVPGTAWTKYQFEFAPSASQTSVRLRVILNWTGTLGYHEAQDIRIEQKSDADLIVDGSIVAGKLAAGSVVAGKLAANAIIAGDGVIGNLAIDTAKIADGAIVTAKIGDAQVTNLKVASGLDAGKITVGTLSAGVIGAGTITADKINSNGLTIRDNLGNVIFGSGASINPSSYMSVPSGWLNSNVVLSGSGGTISLSGGTGSATGIVMPGNPITSGNVSTYIAAGAIGNAYIGNFIQSGNFNGTIDGGGNITANGTLGWAISKGGKAVFQDVVVRGDVQATSLNGAIVQTGNIAADGVSKTTLIADTDYACSSPVSGQVISDDQIGNFTKQMNGSRIHLVGMARLTVVLNTSFGGVRPEAEYGLHVSVLPRLKDDSFNVLHTFPLWEDVQRHYMKGDDQIKMTVPLSSFTSTTSFTAGVRLFLQVSVRISQHENSLVAGATETLLLQNVFVATRGVAVTELKV